MRACFLGQNVTALGFGVAMLQTPPLPEPEPAQPPARKPSKSSPAPEPAPPRNKRPPEAA